MGKIPGKNPFYQNGTYLLLDLDSNIKLAFCHCSLDFGGTPTAFSEKIGVNSFRPYALGLVSETVCESHFVQSDSWIHQI